MWRLMLHEVRTAAAESGEISTVFAGLRKAGKGQSVDEFYLHRGCTGIPGLMSKPPGGFVSARMNSRQRQRHRRTER